MSPTASQHPSSSDLAAFSAGKLTPTAAGWIAQHLQECPACQVIAENPPTQAFIGVGDTPSTLRSATIGEFSGATAFDDIPPALRDHSRYRILRKLGHGGMGVVYLAEHRVMERLVAIKVISRALVDNPAALERFRREVRAAAKLDHPNIVKAYDAEQVGDLQLLAMEFVEGHSLADVLIRSGPLPIEHACHYIHQAAMGLQHAFEQGMVHRDLKPQNLMLTPKGTVKILDFGLAKVASEQSRFEVGLTQENAVMGTPEYMSPEQAINTKTADIRADIYSLGCTLYCLLAGRPPFTGNNPLSIIVAHAQSVPPPVETLRHELPAPLSALVKRLLAKNPNDRPQTPKEVADALAAFMKTTESPGAKHGRRWLAPALVAAGMTLVGLGLLAGGVFKLKSNDGLLVVQVNEPNADVFVDGDPMTATWTGDGKTTVLRVKPGNHQVEVKKSGFTNDGAEVTVAERGRSVITATLKPAIQKPGLEHLEQVVASLRQLNFGQIQSRTSLRQHALDEVTSAMKSVEAGANLTDLDVGRHLERTQKDITDMKALSMSGVTNKKAVADAEHSLDAALSVRTNPKGEARLAIVDTGRWTIEGQELVQNQPTGAAHLRFGNLEWADYDFSCDVQLVQGTDHVSAIVRAVPRAGSYFFKLGAGSKAIDSIVHARPPRQASILVSRESPQPSLQPWRWHTVRVRVRGDDCACYLDDVSWLQVQNLVISKGRVGLQTLDAICRFRNLRVTDSAGAVLWTGLPTLPTVAAGTGAGPGKSDPR